MSSRVVCISATCSVRVAPVWEGEYLKLIDSVEKSVDIAFIQLCS